MKKILLFLVALILASSARASLAKLEWDANTETDLAGYRLHMATFTMLSMSTQAAAANPLIKILQIGTTTQISTGTFVDALLAAGSTFYFRLTAFDTSNNQSGFNQKSATDTSPDEIVFFAKIGDVDGDNKITLTDLSLLLSNYFSNKPEADFNNDGKVTLTDLSLLLSYWGK